MNERFGEIISKQQEKAETIAYSPVLSEQISHLLAKKEDEQSVEYLERVKQVLTDEIFSQIAPEVKDFLRKLTEEETDFKVQELEALALVLLSAPKPGEQVAILEQNQELLNKEKNSEIKKDTKTKLWIERALSEADSERRLLYFGAITKEERANYKEEIEKALSEIGSWHSLFYFRTITKEERANYKKEIEEDLSKTIPGNRLNYFGAITEAERANYEEEIEEALSEADSWIRLNYFGTITKEERANYKEEIEESLSEAGLRNNLAYFGAITPEERKVSQQAEELSSRIMTQITSEIGDVGLRQKYLEMALAYLSKEESSIIALNKLYIPKDKLALALGIESLGSNALPALSWRFSTQQNLELLYSLARLSENKENQKLLQGISLPFRPRSKEVLGFERGLVSWFRSLDFLNSLGENLDARTILEQHLNVIQEKQEEEGITPISTVKISFLKEIVREVHLLKEQVKEKFQEALDLTELTPEEFERFIDSWNSEVESIITLSHRLHEPYPLAKKLLKRIVEAEIKGRFKEARYDTSDSLTEQQLAPLLEGKTEEEATAILEDWHKGIRFLETFKAKEKETKGPQFVLEEHIRQRLTEALNHQHLEELWNISPFNKLSKEEKESIQGFVTQGLLPKEEQKKLAVKNPKELFQTFLQINKKELQHLVKLSQFLKDADSGRKTATELLTALDKITDGLPEGIANIAFIREDINSFLRAELQGQEQEKTKETKVKRRELLVHTTDNAKTMLEIGKYPLNSGSCQSYDYSDLSLAKSLLGYVFDAHIQAVIVRQVETEEEISEIVSLDEGKGDIIALTKDGKQKTLKISKPLARAIFFLGRKGGQPIMDLQPDYHQPGSIEPELARQLERDCLNRFISELNAKHQLGIRWREEGEEGITISGSHNPEGHYNDLASGQRGEDGEPYEV